MRAPPARGDQLGRTPVAQVGHGQRADRRTPGPRAVPASIRLGPSGRSGSGRRSPGTGASCTREHDGRSVAQGARRRVRPGRRAAASTVSSRPALDADSRGSARSRSSDSSSGLRCDVIAEARSRPTRNRHSPAVAAGSAACRSSTSDRVLGLADRPHDVPVVARRARVHGRHQHAAARASPTPASRVHHSGGADDRARAGQREPLVAAARARRRAPSRVEHPDVAPLVGAPSRNRGPPTGPGTSCGRGSRRRSRTARRSRVSLAAAWPARRPGRPASASWVRIIAVSMPAAGAVGPHPDPGHARGREHRAARYGGARRRTTTSCRRSRRRRHEPYVPPSQSPTALAVRLGVGQREQQGAAEQVGRRTISSGRSSRISRSSSTTGIARRRGLSPGFRRVTGAPRADQTRLTWYLPSSPVTLISHLGPASPSISGVAGERGVRP